MVDNDIGLIFGIAFTQVLISIRMPSHKNEGDRIFPLPCAVADLRACDTIFADQQFHPGDVVLSNIVACDIAP